jgi:AraC-like DNA-binding protein
MEELYRILNWAWIAVTFSFGLCLLLLRMPDSPALTTCRRMHKLMAMAYLLLTGMNVAEVLTHNDNPVDGQLTWLITLTMAAAQSVLFSFSLIGLINPSFASGRRIVREMMPVAGLTVLCAVTMTVLQRRFFAVTFYLFTAYYGSMLLRYTVLFIRNHRRCRCRDRFDTQYKPSRLRWVRFLFVMALAVGVGALTLVLTTQVVWYSFFTLGCIGFYAWFGIEFINYAFRFGNMLPVVKTTTFPVGHKPEQHLRERIREWEAEKKYMRQGVTIKQMAADVRTNRAYLSNQINTCYGCSFKVWINRLRIEEAKRLLIAQPELPAGEIGYLTGYADKSHFSRNFAKYEGVTPIAFRKQQACSADR